MRTRAGITRAVVLLSAAGALAASLGAVAPPWGTVLVFWFVAVVPGMAIQPWLGVADPVARATLAVAISVALAALTSEALAITSTWSPTTLVVVLAVLSALATLRRSAVA